MKENNNDLKLYKSAIKTLNSKSIKNKVKKGFRFIPDNPETKEEKIEFLLKATWNSLQSHLHYIHKEIKNFRVIQGGAKMTNVEFEKQCIKEYAKMIKIIADLL